MTVLGLNAAEITSVQDDYHVLHFAIFCSEELRTGVSEFISYKKTILAGKNGEPTPPLPVITMSTAPTPLVNTGILDRLRKLVQRIKASPLYTESIGMDLGIIAAQPTPPAVVKPAPKVTALPENQVEITFTRGIYDGVALESKRAAETAWSSLGMYPASPIIDTRPLLVPLQPELRQYRMRFVRKNTAVGDFSDIFSIVTEP